MPRGGGRGSWRGGRPKPGTARIGGVDIAYDDELQPHLRDRPKPALDFPPYHPPVFPGLTSLERRQVAATRAFRASLRERTAYIDSMAPTTCTDPSTTQHVHRAMAERTTLRTRGPVPVDPFEGVETYSQRYVQKKPRIRGIRISADALAFFPPELHMVLDTGVQDPDQSRAARAATVRAKASANLQGRGRRLHAAFDEADRQEHDGMEDTGGVEAGDGEEGEGDGETGAVGPGGRRTDLVRQPDGSGELFGDALDPLPDDEDDEDDMAGDYNAERYFDDGGDDGGEDEVDIEGGEY